MLLSVLLENFNDDLVSVAGQLNLDPQVFHDQLKDVDPSQKHGNYILKLIRSRNIRWPEDAVRVGEAIKTFTKVKSRLPVGSRDINKFKTILELENTVEPLAGISSKKQGGLGFDPVSLPGVEVVKTVGSYRIIKVSDPESLKKLGEGTKWCTRGSYKNCQAEYYINKYGAIFVLFDGDVPTVQWTPNYDQVMDKNDEELVDRSLARLIGYEEFALGNACAAYRYASNVIRGRWVEAESVIVTKAWFASCYACNIIKGRWPEAEPVIMTDDKSTYNYVRYVIRGRWLEAEPIILTDALASCNYARDVIKGRWSEAEPIILTDALAAHCYARDVIEGRWSAAEPVIMMDAYVAYCYARDVIKGRWPLAEPTILKSEYAEQYKKFVK